MKDFYILDNTDWKRMKKDKNYSILVCNMLWIKKNILNKTIMKNKSNSYMLTFSRLSALFFNSCVVQYKLSAIYKNLELQKILQKSFKGNFFLYTLFTLHSTKQIKISNKISKFKFKRDGASCWYTCFLLKKGISESLNWTESSIN